MVNNASKDVCMRKTNLNNIYSIFQVVNDKNYPCINKKNKNNQLLSCGSDLTGWCHVCRTSCFQHTR